MQTVRSFLVPVCVAVASCSSALAAGPGAYLGVGVGSAMADLQSEQYYAQDLARPFKDLGFHPVEVQATVTDEDTGWRVFGGYRFNENFAVEAAYSDLGEFLVEYRGSFPTPIGVESFDGYGNGRVKAWSLSLLAGIPVTERLSVYAKAGVFRWERKGDTRVDYHLIGQTDASYGEDDGTDVNFGAGLMFDISESLAVRAEYERFRDIDGDDLDLASINLSYAFGN